MKLHTTIEGYLVPTATIDAEHPAIVEQAQQVTKVVNVLCNYGDFVEVWKNLPGPLTC